MQYSLQFKIKYLSSLVKTDYNTKSSEFKKKLTDHNHDKYIATPEFNTLAAEVFNARLAQANLITKTDFDANCQVLIEKLPDIKHLFVQNKSKKLNTFDSIYFSSKSHFEEDGTQNYLVFQPIQRCFKTVVGVGNGNNIYYWNLKHCLMKEIILLKHLIMELLQN